MVRRRISAVSNHEIALSLILRDARESALLRMTARFAGRTAYFGARFTASSKLAFADPGRSGFGWLSWGAQPDSQITS